MCLAEESLGGSQVGFQLSVYWRRRMGWSEGIDGLGSTTRAGRQAVESVSETGSRIRRSRGRGQTDGCGRKQAEGSGNGGREGLGLA